MYTTLKLKFTLSQIVVKTRTRSRSTPTATCSILYFVLYFVSFHNRRLLVIAVTVVAVIMHHTYRYRLLLYSQLVVSMYVPIMINITH